MKQLILLVSELFQRLKIESPDTFKKLQWYSGIICALISSVLALNEVLCLGLGNIVIYCSISLPELLIMIVTLLGGVFGASKLPVKEPEKLKK